MKILVNLGDNDSRWLKKSRTLGMVIKPLLESLVTINQIYLSTHKVAPLYELARAGKVVYRNEPDDLNRLVTKGHNRKVEDFAAIPAVLERGWADCDDLAPWLCAELRMSGEKAGIRVQWRRLPSGSRLYHIVVRRGDGTVEDPSFMLGMR